MGLNSIILWLHKFSNSIVLYKTLLMQEWVLRLGAPNISIFPSSHNNEISHQNIEKHGENLRKGWWSGTKVFQSRTLVVQIEHNIAKFGQKLFSYYPDIYKIGMDIGSRTQ